MKVAGFLLVLLASPALAAITPEPGSVDSRIRSVDYDPNQVYVITAIPGRKTVFELAPDERLLDKMTASGDSLAYELGESGPFFWIKPKIEKGETDITVFTTRGVYHFLYQILAVRPPEQKLIMAVKFRYPQDAERAKTAEARKSEIDARLRAADNRPRNYDYRFQAGDAQ